MINVSSVESDDDFYRPAHKLALCAAGIHLAICAGLAIFTQTWILVLVVGVPAVAVPAWLALRYPGALISRLVMGAAFMILTSLAIQQSGGDLEAHFSFFVMLSVLVTYYDWRPIFVALVVLLLQHALFTVLQPLNLGLHVWNDGRNGWQHTGVHVIVATLHACALIYLTQLLHGRRMLEIENAALDRSLRHISTEAAHDALTGLSNRRFLDRLIGEVGRQVESGQVTISLCAVDLDRFKAINDHYGHPAGDEVLRSTAQMIKMTLDAGDHAIRLGGEEFLVVLRGKSLSESVRLSELLRSRIAATCVATRDASIPVTASIGVAAWRQNESFHDCYARMDRALYLAKKAGRDRVRSENDLDSSEAPMTLACGRV